MPAVEQPIPLLDLTPQNGPLRDEIRAAIDRVISSQRFILGDEVRLFEAEVAAHLGVPHAIGCASGSDALLLALMAAGVGPGDAVLTSPFTFFATAGSITHAGATPVFCDIDPETYNLNPELLEEAAARSPLPVKAVMPVHLYGGAADMDPILETAGRHGWTVIEDAAQAIGATYKGRAVTGLGAIGCLSFFPSKNLGAFGDAGMVTTTDAGLADRLLSLRVHGSRVKYLHEAVGLNSRLDTIQAAVLRVKLKHLDEWTAGRQRNAELYRELLAAVSPEVLRVPWPAPYQTRHVVNQFVVRVRERDRCKEWLAERGIGSEVYYPLPLHLQPCYLHLGYEKGAFPESEKAATEVLALPVHSGLGYAEIERISQTLLEYAAK